MKPDAVPVVIVAALARNGVIGDGRGLPWHIPEDMAHFRTLTQGCPVIMGRRTWDSLPARFRPLPGRDNIVLTRQPGWNATGARVARELSAALRMAQQAAQQSGAAQVCVIGGGDVYAQALAQADQLELTRIDRNFDAATHFPEWDPAAFELRHSQTLRCAEPNDFELRFETWKRVEKEPS